VSVALKKLYEERATLVKQSRDLNDKTIAEKRDFNAEEQAQWETINKDISSITSRIERTKQLDEWEGDKRDEQEQRERNTLPGREDQRGNPGPGGDRPDVREEDRDLALRAFCRSSVGKEVPDEERDACKRLKFNPFVNELTFRVGQKARRFRGNALTPDDKPRGEDRALSIHTGTSAAFAIKSSFVASFEEALAQYGGIRNVANIWRTSTGEETTWPTVNDTGNKGRRLGENKQVGEIKPGLGTVTFRAYDYTSDAVLLPYAMIEDAAFDIQGYLGAALAERIARILAEECTIANGNASPTGLAVAASQGKVAAAVAAITFDEVLELIHSVDPAYRLGGGFMFNDTTLLLLKKLKDGQNNYLWQPSAQEGQPDRLHGYAYQIAMEMASPAASARSMLFGQLRKYWIRDVNSVRVLVLKERYADYNQIGIVAFSRHDGNLMDAGTKPVKYLIQAAA